MILVIVSEYHLFNLDQQPDTTSTLMILFVDYMHLFSIPTTVQVHTAVLTNHPKRPVIFNFDNFPISFPFFPHQFLSPQADGPLIFNGLSLNIPSGNSCALVGRTGCGKSSFLSALVRLYPLCGGKLHVHGCLAGGKVGRLLGCFVCLKLWG